MDENQLSPDQKKLVDAVLKGVAKQITHKCAFDERDRKILHDICDAADDEGANHETHIIIFRIGNNVRSFAKRAVGFGVYIILALIAAAFYIFVLRPNFFGGHIHPHGG